MTNKTPVKPPPIRYRIYSFLYHRLNPWFARWRNKEFADVVTLHLAFWMLPGRARKRGIEAFRRYVRRPWYEIDELPYTRDERERIVRSLVIR